MTNILQVSLLHVTEQIDSVGTLEIESFKNKHCVLHTT